MKILVLGGTRFFGIPMVEELIQQGHEVTIATRQTTNESLFFGSQNRIAVGIRNLYCFVTVCVNRGIF